MSQYLRKSMSGFCYVITTITAIVVFVSCSSLRQNSQVSARDSQAEVPIRQAQPEWVACKMRTDCIKVKGFCKLPASIHRDYKDDFLMFVKQNKDSINCSRYRNIKYGQITEVACENNQCTLIIP